MKTEIFYDNSNLTNSYGDFDNYLLEKLENNKNIQLFFGSDITCAFSFVIMNERNIILE